MTRTESKRYKPVGRCIYCPSTEQLTEEHILPDGMGGRMVLPDASCKDCRIMTCHFEGQVMRGMMWPLRIAFGVRGSKRRIPEEIKTYVPNMHDDGASLQTRAPSDIPAKAVLPVFKRGPGMLCDQPRDAKSDADFVLIYDPVAAERAQERGEYGVSIFAHEKSFMRMLAKIAHAQAVAAYGVDGFEPFLLDIIADRASDWCYFIGGDIEIGDDRDHDGEEIWVNLAYNPLNDLLVSKMQFFTSLGAPVYTVVIGRRLLPFGQGMIARPLLLSGNNPLARLCSRRPIPHHQDEGPNASIPRISVAPSEAA